MYMYICTYMFMYYIVHSTNICMCTVYIYRYILYMQLTSARTSCTCNLHIHVKTVQASYMYMYMYMYTSSLTHTGHMFEKLLVHCQLVLGGVARLLQNEAEVEGGGLHPFLLELVDPV